MFQESAQNKEVSNGSVPSTMTVQERQFQLSQASQQYSKGEITEAALEALEKDLEVDYAEALLDQTSVWSEVVAVLKKWMRGITNAASIK